ncbi:GAK19 protein, partial [Oenanthe oenanthe]|nr:GAK19 protein [Oenanthe oenanthe]
MDRQVEYELFTCTLQQCNVQGIDLKKDLPGLLAWGYAKGCFVVPCTVHELSEWRKLHDKLWDAVLDDDKEAKKLGKIWRVVHNALLQQVADKRAAEQAIEAHKKNLHYGQDEGQPLAPTVRSIRIPPAELPGVGCNTRENVCLSAPPLGEQKEVDDGDGDIVKPRPPSDTPLTPATPNQPHSRPDLIQGSESDLMEGMARQRREAWKNLAYHEIIEGDGAALQTSGYMPFPATYTPVYDQQGDAAGMQAEFQPLDCKLLAQLRETVSQFGFKSEPVKQMLDYLFDTQVLLPKDLQEISQLMLTEHQLWLFEAHWQALVNESVATQRQQGDPLHGVTADELMGRGNFLRREAQLLMGADKAREAMRVFRNALDRVKEPGGVPPYMGIKQGREEPFGTFIDRVAAAIEKAGVPNWMKGALLRQCAIQNSNAAIQRLIATLPGDWRIEELLEQAAVMPTGSQAFLVDAIKELGVGLKKQAEAMQSQVLAALAALQASAATSSNALRNNPSAKCYRCGKGGHLRRVCRATGVWCQTCQSDTHNTAACRRKSGSCKSGSRKQSASSRATTQVTGGKATAP